MVITPQPPRPHPNNLREMPRIIAKPRRIPIITPHLPIPTIHDPRIGRIPQVLADVVFPGIDVLHLAVFFVGGFQG